MPAVARARIITIPIRTVTDLMDHDDIVRLLGGVAVNQEMLLKQGADLLQRIDRQTLWQERHDEFTRSSKEIQDQLVKDVKILMEARSQTTGTMRAVTWGVKIAWCCVGVLGACIAWLFGIAAQLIVESIKRNWK